MMPRGLPRRPRLAEGVRADRTDEGVVLRQQLARNERVHALGPGGEDLVDRVLPLLDGERTLEEILAALEDDFDRESLIAALDLLAERLLIVDDREPTEPVDGLRAYRILRRCEMQWNARLRAEREKTPALGDPAGMLAPEAYRRWFVGWWTENLHFAAAAPMKFAQASNRSERHRRTLASFFLEEHDHILIFRKGARALGVDPDVAMRTPPLPEVSALNAFVLRGGKRQPLYLAWIADQVERAQTLYMRRPTDGAPGVYRAELQEQLADAPEFLQLVFSHADIEQAAAHATGGRTMFEETDSLDPADLAEIRELAFATELLFHRKELAVLSTYGTGTATPPRTGDNELARLPAGSPPVDLSAAAERVIGQIVAALGDAEGVRRPGPDRARRLARGWAHLLREWARASFETPVLARRFDHRYLVTRLAVALAERSDRLEREGPIDLEARSLAAVVAEAAETNVLHALAQGVLLDRVGSLLASGLGGELPDGALAPLTPELPDRPGGPVVPLAALGTVGSDEAQSVGAHLQVLAQLLQRWLSQDADDSSSS